MVAMTRAQIADPEFANKVREGREDEIVHCIRGNQGCIGRVFKGLPIACTVNPAAGPRGAVRRARSPPAEHPARWLVAGGGPAGMKAAATLARARPRGHARSSASRRARRPGEPDPAHARPRRVRLDRARPRGAAAAGSASRCGSVPRRRADARARARRRTASSSRPVPSPRRTGFSSVNPLVEQLPGVDQDNVLTGWDVLLGARPVGGRVVVLDDDGIARGRGRRRGAARRAAARSSSSAAGTRSSPAR